MSNQPFDQRFTFDTELSLSGPYTASPQLIGILSNEPVILLAKNQTNGTIFFGDDPAGLKGTTMVAGESFVLDCRGNKGKAVNGGFPSGTSFFATVPIGSTGSVKISIVYAH